MSGMVDHGDSSPAVMCATLGHENQRATRYVSCEGNGSYPYCDECAAEARAEWDAEAERVRLREALTELVALKDGPRDEDYYRRKPLAWQKAREALS